MKKILITRKLIKESEDKATKTFDTIFYIFCYNFHNVQAKKMW